MLLPSKNLMQEGGAYKIEHCASTNGGPLGVPLQHRLVHSNASGISVPIIVVNKIAHEHRIPLKKFTPSLNGGQIGYATSAMRVAHSFLRAGNGFFFTETLSQANLIYRVPSGDSRPQV